MEQTISIIATGQTPFGEHWDKSLPDLIADAVHAALAQAPCTPLEIDTIIVANMIGERLSGQAHLGALTASLLPHHPPALRVEAACASGAVAIHTACALLESGKAQTVLVVGAEKMTDATTEEVAAALMGAADSQKDTPTGVTFPGLFGLVAQRYMHEYNLSREDLSCVSAMHHCNAVQNPYAQFRKALSPEEISGSPLIADPLRLLDCSPISDGAAACILSTKFEAPVRIAASQLATDAVSLTDRPSITSFRATKIATERSLGEAGIKLQDVQAIELHDCFSIAAVISVEDMGLAEPGRGVQLYKKPDNGLVLNPSGGLKACGHPVAATGVKQVIEISKWLQKNNLHWGATHNFGGTGATCGMHILEHRHG